ncbi:Ubiquitin-like-specific protease 1 [Halotydeus destructor]|nr:Ubiquitin-like-specific protease 1 [Halotydeus destructor]
MTLYKLGQYFPENAVEKSLKLFEDFNCLPTRGLFDKKDRTVTCVKCEGPMSTVKDTKESMGWILRCKAKTRCTKISPKTNTFFSKLHLKYPEIVRMIFLFVVHYDYTFGMKNAEVASNTFVQWYQWLREVMARYNSNQDFRIGGPGVIVEMDESQIFRAKRTKNGTARPLKMETDAGGWIIGGRCRSPEVGYFMTRVKNRTAAVVDEVVYNYVRDGTTLVTDSASVYLNLQDRMAKRGRIIDHKLVNHSKEFIKNDNPMIHTQSIENMWRYVKLCVGSTRTLLGIDLYLQEYMFRQKFFHGLSDGQKFLKFLEVIAAVYPGPGRDAMEWLRPVGNDVIGDLNKDEEESLYTLEERDDESLVDEMANMPMTMIDVYSTQDVSQGFPGLLTSVLDNSDFHAWKDICYKKLKESGLKEIKMGNYSVSKDDLWKLYGTGDGWLSDNVISAYLDILQHQSGNVSYIDSIVSYDLMKRFEAGNLEMSRFVRQHRETIADLSVLFIPVFYQNHWTMFAFRPAVDELAYYDSFNKPPPGAWLDVVKLMIEGLRQKELGGSYQPYDLELRSLKVPQQNNAKDCGVYILAYAECLTKQIPVAEQVELIRSKSTNKSMYRMRHKICHHILKFGDE